MLRDYTFKISYGPSDDRLHDFYIPALERSRSFDRTTGFFSSAALAIAAAGVVRLIQNGGRMRLLCGADLSQDDVEAIRKGASLKGTLDSKLTGCLADPSDQSMRARLEALAWMVAQGNLEIRVVLPRGPDGHPLPADQAREYYHPKEGLFTDDAGNELAFSGSSNDSANGWQWNYEVFSVYASWPLVEGVPALTPYVAGVRNRFQRLWEGKEENWIAVEIPEAARQKLLRYCPDAAPIRDALERNETKEQTESTPPPLVPASVDERLIFQFLRDAPYLPNANLLGVATGGVQLWPHQLHIVTEAIRKFPANFLFSDEVGLGKTIEVGAVIRQLVISERVKRCLLLTPKSVMKQWQEELHEKFALDVPRYDGGTVRDVFDQELDTSAGDVWNQFPLLIASSQLAKRQERQGALLSAQPWDLIVVDEAHHARRRDFLDPRFRPNRLLELLGGTSTRPGLKDRARCLYLMTATPMQIHPVEVWDLLRLLGLGGRWGASEDNFLRYFAELRKPEADRKWDVLLDMMQDHLGTGGEIDPAFASLAENELGFFEWDVLRHLPTAVSRASGLSRLSERGKAYLTEMLRRHTPLNSLMWRNTRTLLRKYKEKGLLDARIPIRKPHNEWIPLKKGSGQEFELYERVEEYISHFYQKYENERKGLGFVMTVYRRRLTSSFAALAKSLERRRRFIRGMVQADELWSDDDVEQAELDYDILERLTDEQRQGFKEELGYIDDFLHRIGMIGTDSKLERLQQDLSRFFAKRDTVIVFTQYTDTMDYLRDQLRHVYGSQVACYSGRGGEIWDGAGWVNYPKESLKELFRQGEKVKILLCTESASEGLNLQTCGVLINFDVPWNPMRVEQRIGRIDRIGQQYREVYVRNYFYAETVEAVVYQRLEDRIRWFEDIVGSLQPILHGVSRAIELLAMMPASSRARRIEEEIATIREQMNDRAASGLDLDAFIREEPSLPRDIESPITLSEIEAEMLRSPTLGRRFRAHPELPGAYLLEWRGSEVPVTFNAEVYDAHPYTVSLVTYGNPLFHELIAVVPTPDPGDDRKGIARAIAVGDPKSLVLASETGGQVKCLATLADFRQSCENNGGAWDDAALSGLNSCIQAVAAGATAAPSTVARQRTEALRLALAEEARQILARTAAIDLAIAATPDLFATRRAPQSASDAIAQLIEEGVPFRGLASIAGQSVDGLSADDPFVQSLQGQSSAWMGKKRADLCEHGWDVLRRYKAFAGVSKVVPERQEAKAEALWLSVRPIDKPEQSNARGSLRILRGEEKPADGNWAPLYDLEAAAGGFGESRPVEVRGWVDVPTNWKVVPGMFAARVVGHSMEPRIPAGTYCLFKSPVTGSRQGRIVLVQHRDVQDPETGGCYTVKVYESEKSSKGEPWAHTRITLRPLNKSYQPVVLTPEDEGAVTVAAEFVGVLEQPGRHPTKTLKG
jgi:superfamily II DNA or RNA helicase